MARVVFLVPKVSDGMGKPATPHVGVACLAAYVREKGHEPHVIDLRVEPECTDGLYRRLKVFAPDFVAVTSTSLKYREVYELINSISGWGWPVIYGGPHASLVRAKVYEDCEPFTLVCGEGEIPLTSILDGKDLTEVRGVVFRDDQGLIVETGPSDFIENVDELPPPAYDLFRLNLYAEKKIPLISSRGCPCYCTFCGVDRVMGRSFRPRSAKNLVAEIEAWYKKGYRVFGINDDNFAVERRRVEEICDLVIEKGLKIDWELRTGVRVDTVDEDLLRRMKVAGCMFVAFGIESVDAEVLNQARKGISPEQIENAIAAAERVGMPFSGFFLIGLPGATGETFDKAYAFAQRYEFDEVRFYNVEPYPGTPVYDWVQKNGNLLSSPSEYLNDSSALSNEPLFETDDFTLRERRIATAKGESLAVRKLMEKTIGLRLGRITDFLLRQRHLRSLILKVGFKMAPFFRTLHLRNRPARQEIENCSQ